MYHFLCVCVNVFVLFFILFFLINGNLFNDFLIRTWIQRKKNEAHAFCITISSEYTHSVEIVNKTNKNDA